MAVAGQRLASHVPGNVHDGLIPGLALVKLSHQRMARIVRADIDFVSTLDSAYGYTVASIRR